MDLNTNTTNNTVPKSMSSATFRDHHGNNLLQTLKALVKTIKQQRNLISFWIFGLTSNFAYIVSLTAAQDILLDDNDLTSDNDTNLILSMKNDTSDRLICNPIGTGVVLLSAILPELVLKTLMQFSPKQLSYLVQVMIINFCITLSFVFLGFGQQIWLRIVGVTNASIATGLAELAFLSLTSFYHRNTVSAWSSGTGASGIFGALTYAGFTSLGVTTQTFMLIMLVIPATMMLTYTFLLKPDGIVEMDDEEIYTKGGDSLSFMEKIKLIPFLIRYLIPLCFVYFGTYFISHGLLELLYFNNQMLSRLEQFRWYQVLYRVGVFVSRSSVNLVQIKRLWTLPVTMFGIMALLICQVFFRFTPYLGIIMVVVVVEGVVNGVSYVNTFFCVTNEVDSRIKEFALGFVASAGPMGVSLAGIVAVPFHNYICTLDLEV